MTYIVSECYKMTDVVREVVKIEVMRNSYVVMKMVIMMMMLELIDCTMVFGQSRLSSSRSFTR